MYDKLNTGWKQNMYLETIYVFIIHFVEDFQTIKFVLPSMLYSLDLNIPSEKIDVFVLKPEQ